MLSSPYSLRILPYALLLCLSLPSSKASATRCKAVPGSPSWPTEAQWDALNSSIAGRLLAPLPPAAVCDTILPVFNNASCSYVASQWTVSDFHARDPVSVDQPCWTNDACLPNPKDGCDLRQFPRYVVNATSGEHVKAAIDFARNNNVRLIVKGTGHDFLGRSTAPNSLSIWTHNIRGLQHHDRFVPTGCSTPAIPAISVAAGHRMGEIYDLAAVHGSMIIGGDDPDIGMGGYFTGGGHSPISGQYGLGADNVLEFEVVIPSGETKILNQCSNTDLFFALRGGGGATFGVILSATMKTIPMPSLSWSHFEITQTTPDNTTFWQATAYFHSQLPHLARNGMMGYYNITPFLITSPSPSSTSNSAPSSTGYLLSGAFTLLNATPSSYNTIFTPVLSNLSATFPQVRTSSSSAQYAPSFYDWWKKYYPAAPTGADSVIGNRLLDTKALSAPLPILTEALRGCFPSVILIANLVSGPGVWNATPPGGLGSMTPAWRKAVIEMIVPVGWPSHSPLIKARESKLLRGTYMPFLRSLAPDTGSYLNEGDTEEPDFGEAYWGDNYARLEELKRRYDPEGVFWCESCVGRGRWREMGDGRICEV